MPSPRRQKTSSPAPAETGRPSRLRRAIGRLPRLETVFLLAAALVTVAAKGVVIRRHGPDEPLAAWLEVIRADLAFFGALALGVALASLLRPGGVLGRLALVVAAATLGWSVVAAAWLYTSGVQLQPGVLALLARNPSGFAPVVTTRLRQDLPLAVPGLLLAALAAAWLVRRLIRPAPPPAVARRAGLAIGAAFVLVAAILATVAGFPRTALGYHREVLGFSSHWYALADVVSRAADDRDVEAPTRRLPRAGARAVAPPPPDAPRPNVVILLLESVSHASASLDGSEPDTTPALRTLAAEGVEIVTTRVPVAYTSKAFWATFTGSTPDVQPDAAESVLADEPYESIASILGRIGYRSAFYEMSSGAFECAPGLFTNLGFDWAWFLENQGDDAARLGYFNGDDFLMIEPALDWAQAEDGPFLLGLITSVAHDPYEVPRWFGEPADGRAAAYEQAIRFTDAFVAEFCRRLDERGLADDTILCVIGDHGEDLGDEKSRWAPFDEVIRVPWIIRWPGHLEPGRRVEGPASQLDVTPTLLGLIGFDVSGAGFDGIDALAGPLDPTRRLHFAAWYPDSPRGYVEGDRKVVHWPYNDTLFEYDLAADPDEDAPVTIEDPARRDREVEAIERWRGASHFYIPATRVRQRFLYDHWHAFSQGRYVRSYFEPSTEAGRDPP